MTDDPQKLYLEGYPAFDQGHFYEAVALATQCLRIASPVSYWHFGALGLRCWAANYLENDASVKQDALTLLGEDAGTQKLWFDGLALLNLGLFRRRTGQTAEAKELFAQASQRYAVHKISPEQPPEWQLVSDFFAAVTHLADFDESDKLKQLGEKVASLRTSGKESALNMENLDLAIRLYQRHAQGEDVRTEATTAAQKGVSRAFLALILLEVREAW